MTPPVLTVGHSTHPIEEFLALLRGAGVERLVDVRTLPGSRHNPQFNQESLAPSLERAGISYRRDERLGGLRKASHAVAPDVNGFWENASFHRYADYALGEAFTQGLTELIALTRLPGLTAIMCAEAVWWRCHRRIIADHLLAHAITVSHLMPDGRITPATLTRGAVIGPDALVTYPGCPTASAQDGALA